MAFHGRHGIALVPAAAEREAKHEVLQIRLDGRNGFERPAAADFQAHPYRMWSDCALARGGAPAVCRSPTCRAGATSSSSIDRAARGRSRSVFEQLRFGSEQRRAAGAAAAAAAAAPRSTDTRAAPSSLQGALCELGATHVHPDRARPRPHRFGREDGGHHSRVRHGDGDTWRAPACRP